MESKRLGLCQKPLFVVPNHLTEQWASEFIRLYPSASILVATKKDFERANRQKFCARIATGDYDAVIIGHSQFERIPVSQERQQRLLRERWMTLRMVSKNSSTSAASSFPSSSWNAPANSWKTGSPNWKPKNGRMMSSPSSNWGWTDSMWTRHIHSKIYFCIQKCGTSQGFRRRNRRNHRICS